MTEVKTEAKETTEEKAPESQAETIAKQNEAEKSLDDTMDALYDQSIGKEKPAVSSTEEKPAEKETGKEASAIVDPDNAKKEAEAKKEDEIPAEFQDHEAWKRIMQAKKDAVAASEASAARIAELEKGGVLTEEQQATLDSVKELTSSKQYLEEKYRREGFKDEVIKEKLAEAGFDTASAENDIEIAAKALNLDVESLSDQDKGDISNLVKISNALLENKLSKVLPAILNPISEQVAGLASKESGFKLHDDFVAKVKDEGLLDFKKDLEPDIAKHLDANPNITQGELSKFMQDTYHNKLVAYKKAVAKKGERAEQVGGNRPGGEGSAIQTEMPAKTGDFDKDAEAVFNFRNYHE